MTLTGVLIWLFTRARMVTHLVDRAWGGAAVEQASLAREETEPKTPLSGPIACWKPVVLLPYKGTIAPLPPPPRLASKSEVPS